jgi:hypothetical protein
VEDSARLSAQPETVRLVVQQEEQSVNISYCCFFITRSVDGILDPRPASVCILALDLRNSRIDLINLISPRLRPSPVINLHQTAPSAIKTLISSLSPHPLQESTSL